MLIDLTHLEQLFRHDRALRDEWIALYLEESPQYFQQLVEAHARGDAAAMAHAAHDLRPQARYLSCVRMQELLVAIEEAAATDLAACDALLRELDAVRRTVADELRTTLTER